MFQKILDKRPGQILISAILGLGLAMMFRRACTGRNCITIRGPNPLQIENKTYKFEDECYTFNSHISSCDAKHNIKQE